MVSRQEGWSLNLRRLVRGGLLVGSIGLALHLVLPQIAGIERSLRLITDTNHPLVVAAFLAELASEVCYAELLGRSVGVLPRPRTSRSSRGPRRWFMLRLTVTGYGAAHVLPGGGATAAAVTYGALRRRGLDPERVGLALAVVTILVYAALGLLFAGSLVYMLLDGDLDPAGTAASLLFLALLLGVAAGAYAAYRRPTPAKNIAKKVARLTGRLLKREGLRRKMEAWSVQIVSRLREELRASRQQLAGNPTKTLKLGALAIGYWAFDALCLILVFAALDVRAGPLVLLVAYGVATTVATIPLTPGGIGVFEATMLATLSLLGVGSEAAIPVLGYRLFNFWLPIPLAAVFYPTLRF